MYDPSWEEALFVDRAAVDPDAPVSPFVAMQRLVIRMLFDPQFVERVYADPSRALAGMELDPALLAQLLANDRRLWNADRLRRWRAMKILMDELKVTTTLVLHETRKLAYLDAFFSSEVFHRAVVERGYMALAFVAYLEEGLTAGRFGSPHLRAVLALEGAMARSRRELRDARRGHDPALRRIAASGAAPARAGTRHVVQPGVKSVIVPGGTIALVQHIEKYLFQASQVPALALCDDAQSPAPLPPLEDANPTPLLLEPEPRGKVELSEIPASFAHIVAACERPLDGAALAAHVTPLGVAAGDIEDLLAQLVEGGVLRRVRIDAEGNVTVDAAAT